MADQPSFLQLARQRLGFSDGEVDDNNLWQSLSDPAVFQSAFPKHKLKPEQVTQLLAQSRPGPVSSQQLEQMKRNIGLSAISEAGHQALGKVPETQLSGIPGLIDPISQFVSGAFQKATQIPLPTMPGITGLGSNREQPIRPFDPTALREDLGAVAQNTQPLIPSTPFNPSPYGKKQIVEKYPTATAYTDPGLVAQGLAEGAIPFGNPLQVAMMGAGGVLGSAAARNAAIPAGERALGNIPQYAQTAEKAAQAGIGAVFGGEGASQVLDPNRPWQERIQGLAPLGMGAMGLYSGLREGGGALASRATGIDPATLAGPLRDLNHWEDLLRTRGFGEKQVGGISTVIKALADGQSALTGETVTPDQYLTSRVSKLDIGNHEDPTLKGLTTFQEDGRAVISAFQKADVSTMAHELSHVFRRDLSGDVLSKLEGEFGVENGQWGENHEEMFARGFERYLRDGVAPTEGLSGVFSQFKEWLTKIYQNVSQSSLKSAVGPELKNSLDYLLTGRAPEVGTPLDELTTPRTLQEHIKLGGGDYIGHQEGFQDIPGQHMFNDPVTKSTLTIPDTTPTERIQQAIQDKIAASRAQFQPKEPPKPSTLAQHSEEDLNDLGFFSKLARQISGTTKESLPADRWLSAIDNPKSGITKDEIKYSGVKDWLKQQGAAQVSKAQLRDYIVANTVRLEEQKTRSYSPDFFEETHNGVPNFNFEVKNPGSYRDILLKVPDIGKDSPKETYKEYDGIGGTFDHTRPSGQYNDPHFSGQKNVLANLRVLDTPLDNGRPFSEGVIKDFPGPKANYNDSPHALEIMEAQSQWEKEGRLNGWQGDQPREAPSWDRTDSNKVPGPDIPLLQSWKRLVAKRMLRLAAEGGYDQLWLHTGDLVGERYNVQNTQRGPGTVHDALVDAGRLEEAAALRSKPSWTQKLYDEMLPAELERAGRPFGLEVLKNERISDDPTPKIMANWDGSPLDTEEARDWKHDNADPNQPANFRHVIRLTPEARAAILKEGFPLYQRVGENESVPTESIKDKVRGALRAFAGATPNAALEGTAKGIIRQNLGELHQNYQQWKDEFSQARETFLKAPKDLQRAFITDMQDPKRYTATDPFNPLREWMVQQSPEGIPSTGRTPGINPEKAYWSSQLEKYRPVREALKEMFREEADAISSLDPKLQDIWKDNYFPNLWKQPGAVKQVMAQIMGKRPLKGSQGWKRLQRYTLEEGLATGRLQPITDNPIDLAMIHHLESQKFVFGMKIINQLRDAGLVKFFNEGAARESDWAQVNDHAFVAKSFSATEGGMVERGKYLAPEPVAKILNNYLSPRLYGNMEGWKGQAFDKFRDLGNILNTVNLGFSGYHAMFTTLDVMTSFVGQGMERILRGDVMGGASEFAQAPLSPYLTLRNGFKATKEYLRPGSGGEAYARTVEQLVKSGGRIEQDPFYRSKIMSGAFDTAISKMGKADFIPKVLRGTFGMVMDTIVPAYKVGLFHHMMEYQMERLGTDVDPKTLQEVGMRTWDSIDNRLGQMTHDNLFWNNAMKDLAMASIRSVGWNLGTMRELGGGTTDWARGLAGLVSGAPTKLTARMTYPVALVATIGLLGALTHKVNTGENPKELKDYFYPSDGHGGRTQLPSYVKELAAMKRAGEDVTKGFGLSGAATIVGSKVNPALSLTAAMLSNKDFYNTEIANADHPFVAGYAKYIMEALAPFGLKNAYAKVEPPAEDVTELIQNTKDMLTNKDKLMRAGSQMAGLNILAPAWVDRSPALDLAMRYQQSTSPKEIDEETGLRSRVLSWYTAQLRSGDPKAVDTLTEGLDKGKISQKQMEKILERSQEDPLTRSFTYLRSMPQVLSVWKEMTPEEKSTNIGALQKHIMSAYSTLRPAELKRIEPRMLQALDEVR